MKSSYLCPISNTYHVTKTKKKLLAAHGHRRFKFNSNRILRELKEEMATRNKIREAIVTYMRDSYERNKTTEFLTETVFFALQQDMPDIKRQAVQEEVARLKNRDKIIVSLNKKASGRGNPVYFTLAEILEKETDPDMTIEPAKPVESPLDKVGIYKVNDSLEPFLKAIIGHLDNSTSAYEHLVKSLETHRNGFERKLQNIINVNEAMGPVLRAVLEQSNAHYTQNKVNLEAHRDGINENLKFFAEVLERKFDEAIKSADGRDSYRDGFKDGIKFAIEMGLVSKSE